MTFTSIRGENHQWKSRWTLLFRITLRRRHVTCTKNTRCANVLLAEIEKESAYYKLKFSNDKCEVISMNRHNNVKFGNGDFLKHTDKATYLGGILTKDVSASAEIQNRIAGCIQTLRTWIFFGKNTSDCLIKLKLNVFHAVIITKVAYGLEAVQSTKNAADEVDAFQMKGIRQI